MINYGIKRDSNHNMALFITFEGGEGAGKDTQANILIERLRRQKKWRIFYAQEPGTTLLGKMLRAWLRDKNRPLTLLPEEGTQLALIETINDRSLPDVFLRAAAPHSELLAFTIARAQLTEDFILPKLRNNKTNKNIVICNRYADSTVAYQGYGRGLDLDLVKIANTIATQGLKPNLTILLDLDPKDGLARKWSNTQEDHFESAELYFHQRVREGYLKLANSEPERWLIVDATQTKEEIKQIIWQRITQIISSHSGDINTDKQDNQTTSK
jgi:dTMP kinase